MTFSPRRRKICFCTRSIGMRPVCLVMGAVEFNQRSDNATTMDLFWGLTLGTASSQPGPALSFCLHFFVKSLRVVMSYRGQKYVNTLFPFGPQIVPVLVIVIELRVFVFLCLFVCLCLIPRLSPSTSLNHPTPTYRIGSEVRICMGVAVPDDELVGSRSYLTDGRVDGCVRVRGRVKTEN